MTPNEIRERLKKRDLSVRVLAQILEKTPSQVSQVINRHASSRPIARQIAQVLDVKVERLFPDKPAYHGDDAQDTQYRTGEERQKLINKYREKLAS